MKKILTILFCVVSFNSYAQNLLIEQRAINFFAESVLKGEKHVRIFRYDGRIDIDYRNIESAIISMWGMPFCKQSEDRDRKEAGDPRSDIDWTKEGVKLEKQLRALSLDTTSNYEEVRLKVPNGIKRVSGYKNRKFESHSRNRWNSWRNSLLGITHEIYVSRALEFDEIFLVIIQSCEVSGATGIIYYITLDKNGDVTDYCRTTYIS